ncbi:hypothetical protein EBT31_02895 [bacterium]|nr:hypothetical protein [bacterium]
MSRCQGLTLAGAPCKNGSNCHWHRDHGDCSICLEKITANSLFKTECNHCFHLTCAQKWAESSCYGADLTAIVSSCPLCRGVFLIKPNAAQKEIIHEALVMQSVIRDLLPLFDAVL